jgi:hypothetical protein
MRTRAISSCRLRVANIMAGPADTAPESAGTAGTAAGSAATARAVSGTTDGQDALPPGSRDRWAKPFRGPCHPAFLLDALTAGLLLSAVTSRLAVLVFAAVGLPLALWGRSARRSVTLSPPIRCPPIRSTPIQRRSGQLCPGRDPQRLAIRRPSTVHERLHPVQPRKSPASLEVLPTVPPHRQRSPGVTLGTLRTTLRTVTRDGRGTERNSARTCMAPAAVKASARTMTAVSA